MAAYIVVDIIVHDPGRYADYKAAVPPIIAQYGGRYLTRGGAVEVMEGDWQPSRLVILEFPDADAARAFLNAPEYADLRALRQATTTTQMILVQGV